MMTNAVTLSGYSPDQIRTIQRTVAVEHSNLEFDLFMEACRSYRLDPFRKQIFSIIYNASRPEKRKQTIIVSRDGCRVLAQRCGDYRPASEPAVFEMDPELVSATNPKGIVSCAVKLWKQDTKGDWFPVIGEADWDEFAPVKEEWAYCERQGRKVPNGNMKLDASGQWAKMPKVMLKKCAEAQALRAGWPDQFGGVYQEEEMSRFETDATASQMVNDLEQQERQKMVGGPGVMLVFDDTATLEKVALGKVADRCLEFIEGATPEDAYKFGIRNTESLREFWAHDKAAALTVKQKLEAKSAQFDPSAADAA